MASPIEYGSFRITEESQKILSTLYSTHRASVEDASNAAITRSDVAKQIPDSDIDYDAVRHQINYRLEEAGLIYQVELDQKALCLTADGVSFVEEHRLMIVSSKEVRETSIQASEMAAITQKQFERLDSRIEDIEVAYPRLREVEDKVDGFEQLVKAAPHDEEEYAHWQNRLLIKDEILPAIAELSKNIEKMHEDMQTVSERIEIEVDRARARENAQNIEELDRQLREIKAAMETLDETIHDQRTADMMARATSSSSWDWPSIPKLIRAIVPSRGQTVLIVLLILFGTFLIFVVWPALQESTLQYL